MLLRSPAADRPFHLGPHPLEALPRDEGIQAREAAGARRPPPLAPPDPPTSFARATRRYLELFGEFRNGEAAPARAPVPDDPARRAVDIKGGGYFLDAAGIGIATMTDSAWHAGVTPPAHDHVVVVQVPLGRVPEAENPAHAWIAPTPGAQGALHAGEIAISLAGHIRCMGFAATAHTAVGGEVDLERAAVLAGLAIRRANGIDNPFLGRDFALAAVTTDYALASDTPLSADAGDFSPIAHWLGINGARPGREAARRARRPSHASAYPMEQVRRVARPTTLILDDKVPRVPKRAAFFERALRGDLGEKSRRERGRFATKHPFTQGLVPLIRAMAPLQDGTVADTRADGLDDPAANARAVKSLSYHLGADLTGICEIPDYAWFSHHADGRPVAPYHRYAVVMLIDQGYDTMEGASGDDWISGAQSMRGYMRGAEIAGVIADVLREAGVPARPQTNTDSDVLHIPLVLWAGLGELSRIGELVLNPFVGPRFKSVVLTTDLPLEVDRPIDFGLQYFCDNCLKCARECPCDAIPAGDKVMFNGYEMWKPDVERCTRYRLTNPKGSACGRCMKTCPLNKVVTAEGPALVRAASWLGVNAMWAKPALVPLATRLDDALGQGRRNPAKKWWFDLEVVDGVCVAPAGSNERDIDPSREISADKQRMAYYPAEAMPPGDHLDPWPLDRKAALAMAEELETAAAARRRAGL